MAERERKAAAARQAELERKRKTAARQAELARQRERQEAAGWRKAGTGKTGRDFLELSPLVRAASRYALGRSRLATSWRCLASIGDLMVRIGVGQSLMTAMRMPVMAMRVIILEGRCLVGSRCMVRHTRLGVFDTAMNNRNGSCLDMD